MQETALHVASSAGQLEVVQFLVNECDGVDLHATDAVISISTRHTRSACSLSW